MKNYGIINQDDKLCIYNQDEHRPVLRVNEFSVLVEWINEHPGRYEFRDLVVIVNSDQNM